VRARYATLLLAVSTSTLSASGSTAVWNGPNAPPSAAAARHDEPFRRDAPTLHTDADREFYQSLIHPPSASACRDVSVGPSVAACFALSGLTPEVAALNRVACLFDAVQRYKLAVADCAQQRADQWQETVMWPRAVLGRLTTATLARVQTLREQAEDLVEEWQQPESTRALAAVYTTPERVTRADHERAWGTSRGPNRDQHEFLAWLSVHNRNTIQARTSAAFGLAGELPENTWERIGREGSRMLSESRRDPLAAIRHTPQMLADRARVDTNTARLDAQTLVTEQVLRDFRSAKRKRERALGWALLKPLLDAAEHTNGARPAPTAAPS
jgi:hypothetical protein